MTKILKKYLGMKLNILHHDAEIFVAKEYSSTGMDETLRDNITVHTVKEMYFDNREHTNIVLSYRKITL